MARWIVMRHAEAEPAGPDLGRSLTSTGRADARTMGRWLQTTDWIPQHVLTSPAVRCRQTAQHVAETVEGDPTSAVVDALYRGGARAYLNALRRSPATTTLLVGHLPTVDEVVLALAPDALRNGARKLMTTAAAACFEGERLVMLQRPDELASLHHMSKKA